MTRCNLKLGLYLWAAALFAAFPAYAQTSSTQTPKILEYGGSNKVVKQEVEAFNASTKAADPAALAELQQNGGSPFCIQSISLCLFIRELVLLVLKSIK